MSHYKVKDLPVVQAQMTLKSDVCLIDQVNEIRVQNGMTKLPHIQQEIEARMAK
jgi:hypothetical protein